MISINIDTEQLLTGDYPYTIQDQGTVVVSGKIEAHSSKMHPIMLLKKVLEDAEGLLHEQRNGR